MLKILSRFFNDNKAEKPAEVPPRRRINLGDNPLPLTFYAIGDVHGRLDLLLKAEEKIHLDIGKDGTNGLIVMLGDYIDRGPESAGVLDHLLQAPGGNCRRITLCGNHESIFLDFVNDPQANMHWLDFGGRQTLMSYGIDSDYFLSRRDMGTAELIKTMQDAIPRQHLDFLASLPIYLRSAELLFVHAGVRPGLPLEIQTDEDMMWIREPFLSDGPRLPYIVVHGHTPTSEPSVRPGRIGIDTGAYSTGRLAVLKIKNGKATLLA